MRRTWLALITSVLVAPSYAAISGTVFQDYNGNGIKDTLSAVVTTTDIGVAGVTVTAYGNNSAVCGSAITGASGAYSLTLSSTVGDCVGPAYRIEFNTLPSGYYPSARSTDSAGSGGATTAGTVTQFAPDGATNVNLAINLPCEYCQNNPQTVAVALFSGAQTDPVAGAFGTLLRFPYLASGDANAQVPPPQPVSRINQVGSTWGLAYVKQSKTLFSSAIVKRQVAMYESPVGTPRPGAIFRITDPAGTPNTSLFLDLGAAPYNVPVGTVASNAARGITTINGLTNDPTTYASIGKIGLGDIEASLDGKYLYSVSLADKTVYRIEIDADQNPATPPSAADITAFPMNPATGIAACVNGQWRPWGLGIRKDGALYAGGVCDASTGVAANLEARVYRLDTSSGAYSLALNFSLDFNRGFSADPVCPAKWLPWSDAGVLLTTCDVWWAYPQPVLSDITFDVDGSMILGFLDRFGHQQMADNLFITGVTPTTLVVAAGDILRACASGATWIMQGSAGCPNKSANGQGPGGGEYYFADNYVIAHNETSNGGLAFLPGSTQIAMTAMDPGVGAAAGGVSWLSNVTGGKTRGYELFSWQYKVPSAGTAVKSHGMGDIELLCDNPPIEIGNRVWKDLNANGIQDPNEPPISGVTVRLYGPDGSGPDGIVGTADDTAGAGGLIATAVTDASGEYYFSSAAGTSTASAIYGLSALIANTAGYTLKLDQAADYSNTAKLGGLFLTPSNATGDLSNDPLTDVRDSDATVTNPGALPNATTNVPTIVFATGEAGANNHSIDFGLMPSFSIGNRVWFDTNNDGIANNAETGAAGVKVQLLDGSGTPMVGQAVLTDSLGYYRFDGLPAGSYSVVVTPDNWTGLTGTLPLGTTAGASTAASGAPLAGYQSSAGVTGVTSGPTSSNNTDKGIDPAGAYGTDGVRSGSITVGVALQPIGDVDAGASGAGANSATFDANDNLAIDFGFFRLTLGDTVWRDDGGGVAANYDNGVKDVGEVGIGGVTVELRKGGALVAVTTTNASGNYVFTQSTNAAGVGNGEPLVAGSDYTLTIAASQSVLFGYRSSLAPSAQPAVTSVGVGTNDDGDKGVGTAAASGATATAAFTLSVSTSGAAFDSNNTYGRAANGADNGTSHKPDLDFGFAPSFAIGNRVWFDTNNNGQIDAAEAPIDGVLMELTNSAGAKLYRTSATDNTPTTTNTGLPIEQNTANGGYYLFDALPVGVFRVRVAASNWASGQPLAGYASSTGATNAGAVFVAADNNKDHGTDPATPAAYVSNGVSSADITLGTATSGSGDSTETGAIVGNPPASAAGNANDNLTIDFGFYRLSVGNLVWSDSGSGAGGVYNDGIRNGTEQGVAGVTVQLLNASAVVVAQTLSDSNGNYSFNQLTSAAAVGVAGTGNGQPILPGTYTVVIPANQTPLAGSTSSADTAGGRTTADQQDNGTGVALTTAATSTTAFTLAPGATSNGSSPNNSNGTTDQPRIDFGFAPGFAIGNRVWLDSNNNGTIDAGEPMAANVVVELLNSVGAVVQTQATNSSGEYVFEKIGSGDFTVRIAKENWTGLTAAQVIAAGSPAGLAAGQKPLSGYNNSTGAGALGAAATDGTDKGIDTLDPTIAGVSSATITLGAGLQPLGEAGTADNDGVGPTTSIDINNNMTIDFGFYKLSVGASMWRDDGNAGAVPANTNNGLRDVGETGMSGVTLELYKAGTRVATATTDSLGKYVIDQGTDSAGVVNGKPLPPGADYQLRVPQATPTVNAVLLHMHSSAAAGSSETAPMTASGDDSGIGTAPARLGVTSSANFTLGASSGTASGGTVALANIDFGFAPTYSLGNRVWVDANNNGVVDTGELGLAGVTVRLLAANGTPIPGVSDLVTDANGYYRFDDLPAGNYIVEISPPTVNGVNYVSSTGTNASATGPYEAGLVGSVTATNDRDHGTQATPTTIRSAAITLGPSALVTGELDSTATAGSAGDNGPNGDAFDVLTVDFGVFLPATLGNFVWFDGNRNGVADTGEQGINGITAVLKNAAGVEIARQLTRNNPVTGLPGFYEFGYLIPGDYRVEFSAPGFVTTATGTPIVTGGPGVDTNISELMPGLYTASTRLVSVGAGEKNMQLDAGFVDPPVVPTLGRGLQLLLAFALVALAASAARKRHAGQA